MPIKIKKHTQTTRLRKRDQVIVISGKDKGKRGEVLRIDHAKRRVVVRGINIVKKAMRKRKQDEPGGITQVEASIHISNVMIAGNGGTRERIGYSIEGGRKRRVMKKSGEIYDAGR